MELGARNYSEVYATSSYRPRVKLLRAVSERSECVNDWGGGLFKESKLNILNRGGLRGRRRGRVEPSYFIQPLPLSLRDRAVHIARGA
jgi:hypothetical protein